MTEHSAAPPVVGDHAVLATRYVGALYALAEQEDIVDAVATDLRNLRRLWIESAEWRFIATDPRLSTEAVTGATAKVVKLADVTPLTSKLLSTLAQNGRLRVLPHLVDGFLSEVATRRGEHHADIRTAQALTPAQRDSLLASLAAILGGKVNMSIVEDPSILGGLTVKLGSKFIDASVKTKIDRLERILKSSVAA